MLASMWKPVSGACSTLSLFFFNDTATTEIYTLSLHDALPIPVIEALQARGKLPLVVGGTRLYLLSLTAPFASGPPPDPAYREGLAAIPSPELHARLQAVDPETAARLHPEDRKRIIRALEVYQASGESISLHQARSQAEGGRFEPIWVALIRDREELYERIDRRVEEMIAGGLIEEVEGFLQEGLRERDIAMQAHGYKEVMGYLLG